MIGIEDMTPEEWEILELIQEECAEVIQAISKCKRHGFDSINPTDPKPISNKNHLSAEVGQLKFWLAVAHQKGILKEEVVQESGTKKYSNAWKYTHQINWPTIYFPDDETW